MAAENDEDERIGLSVEGLRQAMLSHLRFSRIKTADYAHLLDVYHALALAVRDRLTHRWIETGRAYNQADARRVYYLSAEYLLGRQMEANLLTLGLYEAAREVLGEMGIPLEEVLAQEPDPGLGNGGLGRLAACFMDSLATLQLPAIGYGIRYEFGIFRQEIRQGWQVEHPDEWLRTGNPWEVPRHEYTVPVRFGGRVDQHTDERGWLVVRWVEGETVLGVPYDTPIAGYGNETVHTLRLWSARASEQFDLAVFNDGDFRRATERKALSESISKILYPRDDSAEGKELRLRQQYFFVCCAIHDLIRRFKRRHDDLRRLPEKVMLQLNDTHPAIAVAELMRVLVDEEGLPWEAGWEVTRRCIAYTNHTLLPEALERWSLPLFRKLLPRHLQIIEEINRRFLRQVQLYRHQDPDLAARLSIIEEGEPQQIRMANLSVVGAHKVNGVAALHTRLLQEHVLRDFAEMSPEKFVNVTNGVTPRRFLRQCNPRLSAAITARIGEGWVTDLEQLGRLNDLAADAGFLEELAEIKLHNKRRLAAWMVRRTGRSFDPTSLLDVQIKRIHEYKRQLMVGLHAVHLYRRIKHEGREIVPRTILLGGKAAPGYLRAKKSLKVLNDVATTINADPACAGKLRMHFLPDYNVSMAEVIIPATDISEQISMAGKEASGTGNMKFQMNGALTVGTLDGANVEIREAVGPDNFFLFGLDAAEAAALLQGGYSPATFIERDADLAAALDLLESGLFGPEEPWVHKDTVDYLRQEDPFLLCADFQSYCAIQEEAARAWTDPARWWPMVARNIANAGRFSSDRAIREYAATIWDLPSVPASVGG